MWHDLRFGVRTLAKNPGFTAVAVTALALGIGVNATVFSLVNAILYKNLPFAGSDRVLYLFNANTHNPQTGGAFSYPDFRDLQAQVKSLSGLGANTGCLGNFSDSQAFPENYRCTQVSANTFAVLNQKPILGRDFLPEDERPGAPPVAILAYSLWDKRYGLRLQRNCSIASMTSPIWRSPRCRRERPTSALPSLSRRPVRIQASTQTASP